MAKKIGAIISLSIIGILIIATIIMANVDRNYKINCNTPDYISIRYSSNSDRSYHKDTDGEIFNNIINYIDNASKESALSALFGGTLFDKAKIVSTNTTGEAVPSTSNFYVRYGYNNPQALMNGNKKYKDENGNFVYYSALIFSVSSIDDMAEVKVYISPYYDTSGGIFVGDWKQTSYYLLTANYNGLYNYLMEVKNK